MSPSEYESWSRRDRTLAEGLALYEVSLNALGVPRALAEDKDTQGWWLVEWRKDYAREQLEQSRKDEEPPEGAYPIVTLDPNYIRRTPSPSANNETSDTEQ